MRIKLPEETCRRVSQTAVQNARTALTKRGWKSANQLNEMSGPGLVGIKTTAKFLMFQERGTKPFIMFWVKGRKVPLGCKAQPLDAKILTPGGWKLMGDVVIGDEVIDPFGQPSQIVGVYPQGEREIFRVGLADGSQTRATTDHLWSLDDGSTCTTEDLRQRVDALAVMPVQHRRTSGSHKSRWYPRVPSVEPTVYRDGSILPIPAYTMGALLGDGDMSDRKLLFHSADKEIIYRIESELPDTLQINHIKDYRYHIRLTEGYKTGRTPSHPYIISLKYLGLHGHTCYTKFIPEIYKTASLPERIDLLRGLFDTDGSCSATGFVSFYTTSHHLALDVQEVVRSVGGRGSLRSRRSINFSARQGDMGRFNGGTVWVLTINSPVNIFHLARKSERFRIRDDRRSRRIVSVERIGAAPARCIRVSADSGLYVTDDFIPTHNSGDGPHIRKGVAPGTPGYVNIPHRGRVWRDQRWRHPGIQPQRFMQTAIEAAIKSEQPTIKRDIMAALRGELK